MKLCVHCSHAVSRGDRHALGQCPPVRGRRGQHRVDCGGRLTQRNAANAFRCERCEGLLLEAREPERPDLQVAAVVRGGRLGCEAVKIHWDRRYPHTRDAAESHAQLLARIAGGSCEVIH